jgi:hypothetical protein
MTSVVFIIILFQNSYFAIIYAAILHLINNKGNMSSHFKHIFSPMAADVSCSSYMWQYFCPQAIRKGPR